ncbi:helix-turn-helix domain-containing protein [Shewanella sp. SM101]|uniref:GlxA family transcriptional regulator n=1 Tax=Shewanella TaxID=22 RepID=UPI0021D8B0D5|nr:MULTISPECIES: helix-turn-helix domain-containing protein [unclassified Shewanella]MCU8031924.1 helix-turn-helix domain-containing protein [Shewanella sp. SM73]MCU8045727.1 helix-turn-helix domain-containing protein [Shewanella sp. SM68]MCU8049920.1 helix-turn-helix domain-containing protein [Shewanella sp. SM65]MCU8105730.1 helix-turn-helix domain-containing protein [Shewanella sp. SM101]
MQVPTVALILYPHFSVFHVAVPQAVFSMQPDGKPIFDLKIVSIDGKPQHSDNWMTVQPDGGLELVELADIVVIPGWHDLDSTPASNISEALVRAHERGSTVVGLCYGAYALAYSGLLDEKEAATHWMAEDDFTVRFPNIKLNTNALYVESDRVVTSAGTAAALDCCLYIVRSFYGTKTANKVARILVVPPHREGGQAQFIAQPIPKSTQDAEVNRLLDYLRENLDKQYSIADLADQLFMSRRTFTRHFNNATGMSFGKWLVSTRLQRSLELLESTRLSVEKVSEMVGFQTATSFRQHFNQRFHVSPSAWRKTFAGS